MNFKAKVYQVVKRIPRGETMSYKEVARKVGSPRAWRAVGNILNKNRDSKIPCHRVMLSNGKIGGYRKGTNRKISLLKQEGVIIKKKKVILQK